MGSHIQFEKDKAYLNVRTLELREQRALTSENSNMEAVSMRVADQHISGIWYVDSIREVGVVLAANAAHELTFLVEHDNAVTLEVADEKFLAWNSAILVDKKFCYLCGCVLYYR